MANQDIENKKEALKTFVDQTKLLMTLASAFIVAPAAAKAFVENFLDWRIIVAEILFLISVLFSYIVLGTISGSQHKGDLMSIVKPLAFQQISNSLLIWPV